MANHIMVSDLPPNFPTLTDGRVLMAALAGMDKDRFSLTFLNGIQVCCASGSSCNVHPNAAPVEESPHCCMNCTLKFHSCIACSGSCFRDWFLIVVVGERFSKLMLPQFGKEKFDQYNNNLSFSPLELYSYCKSSLPLSMDACRLSDAATTLAKASLSSTVATTLTEASLESNDASGNNHGGITNNSVACADTDGILGFDMRSEQHYKDNKILR